MGTYRKFGLALLATSALIAPSLAHAATPAPKFVDTIDDHGVDLVTALPFFTIEEGGIGSGAGRVTMQRIYAEDAGWADNWTGGLYPVTTGSTTQMYVQFAGISEIFSGSGTTWTTTTRDGTTLTVDANGFFLPTGIADQRPRRHHQRDLSVTFAYNILPRRSPRPCGPATPMPGRGMATARRLSPRAASTSRSRSAARRQRGTARAT